MMKRPISDGADVIQSYIGEARREWLRRRRQRARREPTRPYAPTLPNDERGSRIPQPKPDLAERVRRLLSE